MDTTTFLSGMLTGIGATVVTYIAGRWFDDLRHYIQSRKRLMQAPPRRWAGVKPHRLPEPIPPPPPRGPQGGTGVRRSAK